MKDLDMDEFTFTNLESYKKHLLIESLQEDELDRDWLVHDTLDILKDAWWLALMSAGTLPVAFPDVPKGKTWAEIEKNLDMAWQKFFREADQGLHDVNFIYDRDDKEFAMTWVSGRQVAFGFMNFTTAQREDYDKIVRCGRWVFRLMWDVFGYKSMAGLTPEGNWGAVKFAQACGGKIIGKFPGACYNARRKRLEDGVVTQFLPTKPNGSEA